MNRMKLNAIRSPLVLLTPMSRGRASHLLGFTLVEVLVVIAVIGILVGLLLPAVQAARSASRKSDCGNKLKQLGTAVHQFHERMGTMPTYWGAMKGKGAEVWGGWALHLMPDFDQQAAYNSLASSALSTTGTFWTQVPDTSKPPIVPAIAQSADYSPGTPVSTQVTITIPAVPAVPAVIGLGINIPEIPAIPPRTVTVTETVYENAKGTPAQSAIYPLKDSAKLTYSAGLPNNFSAAQSTISLGVLQCSDDTSTAAAGSMILGKDGANWSLTNYLANTHAFLKFGSRLLDATPLTDPTGTGGLFSFPPAKRNSALVSDQYLHVYGEGTGYNPRQFVHIGDGLSNTILFAEAMRQCDKGGTNRFAFLPSGYTANEHGFGFEPQMRNTAGVVARNGGYGHTLMFQTRTPPDGASPLRAQGNHGTVLMVAMCDGSVRAIASTVSCRESADPNWEGRIYGANTYNPVGRGGGLAYADGVWDMLLVPNDPAGNVLMNTGKLGQEK